MKINKPVAIKISPKYRKKWGNRKVEEVYEEIMKMNEKLKIK